MPTGYTHPVADGRVRDLRAFVMDCARAFGACVTLRDQAGGGDKIPDEFKPSAYYAESAAKDRARMAEVEAMSAADADDAARAEHAAAIESRRASIERYEIEDARMKAMLAEVDRWTPPTPEHRELKKFMQQQLRDSLHGDMRPYMGAEPVRLSAAAWRESTLIRLRDSIRRDDEEQAKENARSAGRTSWVKALRDSFATVPS